jgi:hypothetical protein
MKFSLKIKIILTIAFIISIGSYFLLNGVFSFLENQLFEKSRIESEIGSGVMIDKINMLLKNKILTEKDLFDTNYVKIKNTTPVKYHTKYDKFFDINMRNLEDKFLLDKDLEYAVLIDRNGYVPTHNTKYSQPESSNKKQNLISNRSKRIFINYPGIKDIVKFKGKGTIKSFYQRDTGEKIWNIASPIVINGKHWGIFLIGVNLKRVEELKNYTLILAITITFIILTITTLVILAVIPRRLLAEDFDLPKY